MAPFPEFDEKVTNIATWQYVLNKNSDHKEAALKFLQYVSGYEASKNYGQLTKMCPARLDVIEDKNFDLDGIEMIRQYLKDYKLESKTTVCRFHRSRFVHGNGISEIYAGTENRSGIFCPGHRTA